MSGFGLVNYLTKSSSHGADDNQAAIAAVSSSSIAAASSSAASSSMNSVPLPTPNDTKLPNQPAKVRASSTLSARLVSIRWLHYTLILALMIRCQASHPIPCHSMSLPVIPCQLRDYGLLTATCL